MTPYRVGLIVPSSNVTMETEIPALLSRHPAMSRCGVSLPLQPGGAAPG